MSIDKISNFKEEYIPLLTYLEINEIIQSALSSEKLTVSEKTKLECESLKNSLMGIFPYDVLQSSLYWNALTNTSVTDSLQTKASPHDLESISEIIIKRVTQTIEPLLREDIVSEDKSDLMIDIEEFKIELERDPGLFDYFKEEVKIIVDTLRTEYPDYANVIHKIPEIDRSTGGSESHVPDIPPEIVEEILTRFTEKYTELKVKIQRVRK